MEQKTVGDRKKLNWILTGAVLAFIALMVVFLLLLRPGTKQDEKPASFVIGYGDNQRLTVPASESRIIVIRDGTIVGSSTGEGEENVIHIENGEAWMEHANCPHRECEKQGRLSAETVGTRPLGAWIVCAPHKVTVEYTEGGQ